MRFDVTLVPLLPKGARYFIRDGASTKLNRGFATKAKLDEWFLHRQVLGQLDWRVGSVFRMRGVPNDLFIVNRKGELC